MRIIILFEELFMGPYFCIDSKPGLILIGLKAVNDCLAIQNHE